eukprot:3590686-Amphidinium_carterae.1
MAVQGDTYQRLGSSAEPEAQRTTTGRCGSSGMQHPDRRICIVTVVVVGCCLTVAAARLEGGVSSSSREQQGAKTCEALVPAIPCTRDAYAAWVTQSYAVELQNIQSTAEARFERIPECKGINGTACAGL